jgi:hypothetical protein
MPLTSASVSKLPLFFIALVMAFLGGCGGGNEPKGSDSAQAMLDRMTAEEIAYNSETGYIYRAINEELVSKWVVWVDEETQSVILPGKFDGNWQVAKADMESILPPEFYEKNHQQCLLVIQALIDNDKPKAKRLGEQQIDGGEARTKELLARPVVKRDGSPMKFVYTPPLIPIGQIEFDSNGFNVAAGDSINTPVGSFGMAQSQQKGVTRLVIRANGKQRMFKVDRPFQVFVPTDYGVDISGDGERKLIIDVRKK